VNILAVSDKVVEHIYSPQVAERHSEAELVFGCGDLPYYYLEYIQDKLGKQVFFVRGNHANPIEYSQSGAKTKPNGAIDLHRKVVEHKGFIFAGVEGSLRYNRGPFQYSQQEMWTHVLGLAPRLFLNRWLRGRALDVFITHAPPTGIHDMPDRAHKGIDAFIWLLKVFKPGLHLHGHIHIYRPDKVRRTQFHSTTVINVYGHQTCRIRTAE
jgi:Icc-related predicted phosphoesterase